MSHVQISETTIISCSKDHQTPKPFPSFRGFPKKDLPSGDFTSPWKIPTINGGFHMGKSMNIIYKRGIFNCYFDITRLGTFLRGLRVLPGHQLYPREQGHGHRKGHRNRGPSRRASGAVPVIYKDHWGVTGEIEIPSGNLYNNGYSVYGQSMAN